MTPDTKADAKAVMKVDVEWLSKNSHITVVEQVYYQQAGEQPMSVESRFSRLLRTDEQPYLRRKVRVGEKWEPLDMGWVKQASMVVITNDAGRVQYVNPTEVEANSIAGKILEVSGGWFILPGESMRAHPGGNVQIRCLNGEGCYSVAAVPDG